jgi:hypothetical protein
MKTFYATSLIISLNLFICSAKAQSTPANKTQVQNKTTGKLATKNVSLTVTEMDHMAEEGSKFDMYIKKHMKTLPGVNGYVYISFTNEKNGFITHIKIKKSLTKAADEEALRLIRTYPRWEPNTVDGKPQSAQIVTSIMFGKPERKTNATK